jgi:hypothetical protein
MTDDELIQKLSLLLLDVRDMIAERDRLRIEIEQLRQHDKDATDLTIDQAVEIGQLKRRLGEI